MEKESKIKKMGFKEFLQIWGNLLKKTYLPILAVGFMTIIIFSLLNTFLLTNSLWNQYVLGDQYQLLYDQTAGLQDYEYTEAEHELISSYTMLRVILIMLTSIFMFAIPIMTNMLTVTYVSQVATGEDLSMVESMKKPFVKGKFLGSIFYFLFIPMLVSLGLLFFVVPGFLVLIYSFFIFHAYFFDDAEGFAPIKLSIQYIKGNFFPILFSCFIGFGIPILTGNLFSKVVPLIGFGPEEFRSWVNPESRNYLMIFLYNFVLYGFQGIFYPLLPTISFTLYTKVKNEKLREMAEAKREQTAAASDKSQTVTVRLRGSQKKFKCPNCGTELNAGIKKCYQCGKFIKYRMN